MSHNRVEQTLKKTRYVLAPLVAFLPIVGFLIGRSDDDWMLTAFFTPFVIFVCVPILDWMIGRDSVNPERSELVELTSDRFYRALTVLCLPLYSATVLFGLWVLVTQTLSPVETIGWVLSIGLIGGIVAINPAHELIHKSNSTEQTIGGLLLATVCYGTFKVEHLAGHHVDVATPADQSTAPRGESVYRFILQSILKNPHRAIELEQRACVERGTVWRWHMSESVGWTAVSLGWLVACAVSVDVFSTRSPWIGVAYFLAQALVAITLLEIINYIEHYGLSRRIEDGEDDSPRYERVTHLHSWNSNFALTNALLFQLQRHSDHHAHSFRRYQTLRHHPDSPQLPAGYSTMVLVALVPPLWFRVMDGRIPKYATFSDVQKPGIAETSSTTRR